MLIVNTWSVNEPSLDGGPDRDIAAGPVRLAVDGPGHGHHARVGVDGEPAAVVVLQAVGDRVVRGIGVAGRRGHADRRADDRVFVHRIGRGVTVGDRTDVELVQVVDVDREHLVGERTVARGGPHRDIAAGAVRLAVDGPGHGDDARVGVDGEPSAVVVLQAVGDRVVRGIGVAGRAVTPTTVPTMAFSSTALAVASLSLTAPTSNSSRSLIVDRQHLVGDASRRSRWPGP